MLRQLVVKDFAIIDHAELALGPGMTALTGETGAGKSLMVDALLLLSGARGDAGAIRHGAERAELSAEFDLNQQPAVLAWLSELELDDDHDCRIRRVVRRDGSSRVFVNDRSVTVQTLKALSEQLIEIHGQHEHQALLQRSRQLALLDAYGAHDAALAAVSESAKGWQSLQRSIDELETRAGAGGQQLEFLRFQLDELERHALPAAELAELENEFKRLSHSGELIAGCERALDALDGDHDHAVRSTVVRLTSDMDRLSANDARLQPVAQLLREVSVQLDEATDTVERYRSGQELDPQRLSQIDTQIARLHDLARKHRVPVTELHDRKVQLAGDYELLAGADAKLAALNAERAKAREGYERDAAELSAKRKRTATRLSKEVTALMGELGMAGGRFSVLLEPRAGDTPSNDGTDTAEFMVSANPGQPERPLRKVASGGELARISLAIEVAAIGKDDIGTMVFDEVDSGIGGAVAEVVGRKLKALGTARQVLCVTHLAQVAAQADHHLAISKSSNGSATRTELSVLDTKARLEEVARMLGGVEITAATRAHAKQMIESGRRL